VCKQLIHQNNTTKLLAILKSKRGKKFKRYIYKKTQFLPAHIIQRELTQRIYHFTYNLSQIPTDHHNWYYKFCNLRSGYSSCVKHIPKYNKLGQYSINEQRAILKSVAYVRQLKNAPQLCKLLISETKFMDRLNPSLKQRLDWYSQGITELYTYPVKLNKIPFKKLKRNIQYEKKFINLSYSEKIKFIYDWYNAKNRIRAANTNKNKHYPSICDFVDKELIKVIGKRIEAPLIQKLHHIVNKIYDIPKCLVCGNAVKMFHETFLCYATTCSKKCNNKCRENIEKRLKNNGTNTYGYKTNIGANENFLLKIIEKTQSYSLERQKNIKGYIVDGVDEQHQIVVEVMERHHLWSSPFEKDKIKIDAIISAGYKVLFVFDSIKLKNPTQKKSYFRYVDYFKSKYKEGVQIINITIPSEHVLTSQGFNRFLFTHKTKRNVLQLTTKNGNIIKLTADHKVLVDKTNNIFKSAEDIKIGDYIETFNSLDIVTSKKVLDDIYETYDIVETEDNTLIANNIVLHNCLLVDEADFIESGLLEEFWASVYPIISSSKKSKIIMSSTPRDTSGLFYKIYEGAVKEENGWKYMKVTWDQVPGRGEKWKRETMASLSDPAMFDREFNCKFLQLGETSIDIDLFERLKTECCEPEILLDNGHYKIWETPNPERIYVVGVDISEGIGKDATCMQILDITDLRDIKQVAQYHSNEITPIEFTPRLHEILLNWGKPIVLIERNNCGMVVVDNLRKDFNYENIVNYGSSLAARDKLRLGIISHVNVKYQSISNKRYWLNTVKSVHLKDIHTLNELKTFTRNPNNSWSASSGNFDDRVMSLAWALFILHDALVEKYFEIVQKDDNNKPLLLRQLDYGIQYFMNPTSIYSNQKDSVTEGQALPIMFGGNSQDNLDIEDLHNQGWRFL
jgi:very-short-patch-repair endonuclease